jgi:hypothetical protein
VGYGARSWGFANVYVYDGEDVFLISRWDEFGAGVQKVVCPFLRFSNFFSLLLDVTMVGEHRQSSASPKLGKFEDFPPRSGGLSCASTHGSQLRCLGLLESQSE